MSRPVFDAASTEEKRYLETSMHRPHQACCLDCTAGIAASFSQHTSAHAVPRQIPRPEGNAINAEVVEIEAPKAVRKGIEDSMTAWKIIKGFLEEEYLEKLIPSFVSDTHDALLVWVESCEGSGTINPFDLMRRLILYMTLRVVTCREIVRAKQLRRRSLGITPAPEQATTTKLHNEWLDHGLCWKLGYVRKKRILSRENKENGEGKAKRPMPKDAMDHMLDKDLQDQSITRTIADAALLSLDEYASGGGWVLCFIGQDPKWYARIQKEVGSVIKKHREHDKEHPADVFRRLTLESWRSEFPLIGLCIQDTLAVFRGMLRASGKGRAQRPADKNAHTANESTGPFNPKGKTPDMWSTPAKSTPWNPNEKDTPPEWGRGDFTDMEMRKLSCGTIIDKLQLTITTALFVAHYDFTVCDRGGGFLPKLSQNLSNMDPHMPSKVCLKVKLRGNPTDSDGEVEEYQEDFKGDKKAKNGKGKDAKGRKKKK